MKAVSDVVADLQSRLARTWATDLSGTTASWPHRFPIGPVSKTDIENGWRNTYQPLVMNWRDWARAHQVALHSVEKRVYTTVQDIPTHLEIADIDEAAALVGNGWTSKLDRARIRLELVRARFPLPENLPSLIRSIVQYTEADFELLGTVTDWFRSNDATGYTPRQVPIPGVHAKWLNTHQPEILALSGLPTLGLLPAHPSRLHFTYLDPAYRTTGARLHDSVTIGDPVTLPYSPSIVIISENKDTAIHFPPICGGITIEGGGSGGTTAAAFSWVTDAPQLYYWGDIDAEGYEILNGWRANGVPADTILMDMATYREYEMFGTDTDKHGVLLTPGEPKLLPHLTVEERDVYKLLLASSHQGHRRVEQERIPLKVALRAVSGV